MTTSSPGGALWQALLLSPAEFPWELAVTELPELLELKGSTQDPIHHAEGDVWVHTQAVCDELWADPSVHGLPPHRRGELGLAALLHDISKPETRTEEDGRIRNPGHARRGAVKANRILWELGVPFDSRRSVTALIHAHLKPFHALTDDSPQRLVHRLSWQLMCRDLAALARADINGRICEDKDKLLGNVELFCELCAEEQCLDSPRPFANDHSRVQYFRKPERASMYEAYDDTWGEVTVLCGLPAAGKSTYLAEHLPGLPVVELERIRAEMGVKPTDNQGRVAAEARERAREHLRRKEPFVWSATNISQQQRDPLADLILAYNARLRFVYLEASPSDLRKSNASRANPVPWHAIERMMGRWQVPTLVEAHRVDWVVR